MKRITSLVLTTALFLNACNNNDPEHDSSLEKGITKISGQTAADSSGAIVTDTANRRMDTTNLGTPMNMPVTATPGTTAPGMNPPHGQPGHRCDISVGAPLNSPPAKAATPTVSQVTPTTVTPTATTAKTVTAPGMNPPHGEPGHRCDIAVGASLNSAPAKPATTTSTVTPVKPAPAQITPVQAATGQLPPALQPARKDSGQ